MKRRDLVTHIGGAAAWPLAAGDTAAVFRPGRAEQLAQHPQHRGIAADVHVVLRSVDADRDSHDVPRRSPRSFPSGNIP
jgi:hypothetical protein